MDYQQASTARQQNYPSAGGVGVIQTPRAYDESASKIRDAMGTSEQYLSELHETISRLTNRLETVLSPVPPSPVPDNTKNANIASHVLGRFNILNEGLAGAVQRLQELAQRAEV